MAARVFLASPCRPLVWRAYATAAAQAAPSVSKKPVSELRKPSAAALKTPVEPASSRTRRPLAQDDKPTPPNPQTMSLEEQMENLGKLLTFGQQNPTADIWGQKVDTLDVIIPRPVSSEILKAGPGVVWSQFRDNRWNDVKNLLGLYSLAANNAIPGVITAQVPWYTRWFVWPFNASKTQSTSPQSWLTTCRRQVLDSYTKLNVAISKGDLKEIKRLAADTYLADTLAAQKKKRLSGHAYVWQMHGEVNPAKIVSLRVVEGYLSADEPKFGNRLMVHALVKFDTEQSLEIYNQNGRPLHTPAKDSFKIWDGTVAAEKKRVIEYLVLEKRMWYDGPWLVREQVWDVPPTKKSD